MKNQKFSFIPFGRYVLVSAPVEKIEKSSEEVNIILPPGYKKEEEKHAIVRYYIAGPKADMTIFGNYHINLEEAYLVVERRMLEKIETIESVETYIILDQYIVGALALNFNE